MKPKPKKPILLPRVPSKLILIALSDLRKVERSKKYRVDMGVFHSPESDACVVCFAGSVMAISLGADIGSILDLDNFGDNGDQLEALSDLAIGFPASSAFSILMRDCPIETVLPDYASGIEKFHAAARKLSKELASVGM